ncbi:MAG: hypothetical protein JJ992_04445, partial [Planctomycetes bacterium]|nr:hypothetical protein [Planctomycetota bacterium]
RLAHPEVRELHLESAPHADDETPRKEKKDSAAKKKGKKGKPEKPGPGGLPPPPVHEAADSTEAAQDALRRLFRP